MLYKFIISIKLPVSMCKACYYVTGVSETSFEASELNCLRNVVISCYFQGRFLRNVSWHKKIFTFCSFVGQLSVKIFFLWRFNPYCENDHTCMFLEYFPNFPYIFGMLLELAILGLNKRLLSFLATCWIWGLL